MNRPRWSLVLVLVIATAIPFVTGCDRKPRLVPEGADSTVASAGDSTSTAIQRVRDAWDQNATDGSAARQTAAMMLADLRRHPDLPLPTRARELMDSLALGAEVDGQDDLAIVNFFALGDPAGGSWPQLFWRDSLGVRAQPVEGGGMRLGGTAVRRDSTTGGGIQAAALFTRAASAGPQPLVFVWRRTPKAKQWQLAQTLGPDSLGGVGTARFAASPDSAVLQSRTWQRPAGFEECPSCAHVYTVRRFRWGPEGFSTLDTRVEDSPYVAFVRLIQALAIPDDEMALGYVADPSVLDAARQYGFGEKRGNWRQAPGGEEVPNELTLYRGPHEAYRVSFVRTGGRWQVAHLEATGRTM